jgi:hypothetical protein
LRPATYAATRDNSDYYKDSSDNGAHDEDSQNDTYYMNNRTKKRMGNRDKDSNMDNNMCKGSNNHTYPANPHNVP